ncbi:MAG: putative lipid II flippase FtsW [Firmicutes bacterium]|nr:putative lipid II flippase FtsW [Bacillota bacterium]MDD4264425.1 putative lipid II flippase FtsW [Bacillota bacterium]MDD4693436.1 putative lipid II flippase FtsW [Bacillota bacterium]
MQRKGKIDLWLLLTASLLLFLGLVSLLSASSVISYQDYGNSYSIFLRQAIFAVVGLVGAVIALFFPLDKLRKLSFLILLIAIGLLVVVLIFGEDTKGSKRWIDIGIGTFQPSEVAKLAMIIFLADYLSRVKEKIRTIKGMGIALLPIGIVGVLVVVEPDLGTTVAVMATCFFMLVASGAKKSHLGVLVFLGVLGVIGLAIIEPYRLERLLTFLDYENDPLGDGYQLIQSIYALGSGGILGVGIGQSKQKYLYLPENHTDFIFPIVGEEFGFLGTFLIVSLFALYAWRGLRTAIRATDSFHRYLAVGLTMQIAFQAFMNMGVVTGLLPVTGLTLPFFSSGGSSLVMTMVSVGLLLNVSRYVD